MVLKQEILEFDSFFYSTIGNLSKLMSLLMSSFFRCKIVCLGYIPYLNILSKMQAIVIKPILHMYLINDNFSRNSYLWEQRV